MIDTMLKGVEPDYKPKNFKEWVRDYCNDFHYDRAKHYEEILDKDGDGYSKPTFGLFMYNVYRKLIRFLKWYEIKMCLQRIFRPSHISDNMIWNAYHYMAKDILKMLYMFKKHERHGYPGYFAEYHENEWKSKKEYDDKIESGEMEGGGFEAWERTLDHIIMAFEYIVYEGHHKKETEWFMKHFGMDPYLDNDERNMNVNYHYREIDAPKGIGSTMSSTPPDLDKVTWAKKSVYYINGELIRYAEHVVADGIYLYAKFFRSFWD